jgi:hypothetical protein
MWAIQVLPIIVSKVGGPPTAEDWLEAKKPISVFKLIYNVTVRFSEQLHVTSSTFFHDFHVDA